MAVEKVESATMEKTKDEKKPKSTKVSNPCHPTYFQMIQEALLALNERAGSSPYAIAKFMEEKHKEVLPANFKKMLAVQLKNCAAKEKLIKIKASYKLSNASKKVKVASKTSSKSAVEEKENKPSKQKSAVIATATASVPKSTKSVKKTAVAPKKMKKKTPVKSKQPKSIKSPVKSKQLKSIKSPAAKKSKKTAA